MAAHHKDTASATVAYMQTCHVRLLHIYRLRATCIKYISVNCT